MCTRELSEQALLHAVPTLAGSRLSDAVLHQLKNWCISGLDVRSREEHASARLFPRYKDPESLPSVAALDAALVTQGAARA